MRAKHHDSWSMMREVRPYKTLAGWHTTLACAPGLFVMHTTLFTVWKPLCSTKLDSVLMKSRLLDLGDDAQGGGQPHDRRRAVRDDLLPYEGRGCLFEVHLPSGILFRSRSTHHDLVEDAACAASRPTDHRAGRPSSTLARKASC